MIVEEVLTGLLDGFYVKDETDISIKLDKFINDGLDKLHVVSDFDLTLTAGKKFGSNLGTWDVMDALMPPDGVKKHDAIYQSFRPIERAGKLTPEIAAEKWSEILDLITSYRMKIEDVQSAFLSVATLRTGAKEMFDICETNGIPTVILSSGIRNVIQIMADHYNLKTDYILSNDLMVDEYGRVSGWRKDSLIHVLNKKEMGHFELSGLRSFRPNIILLGDITDDTKMVDGYEDVLRIRVLDPRKGEDFNLRNTLNQSYAAGFDLAVENSLKPVAALLKHIAEAI